MSNKHKKKLDNAMKAVFGLSSVEHAEPKMEKGDLDRKFRLRVSKSGKAKMEEVKG